MRCFDGKRYSERKKPAQNQDLPNASPKRVNKTRKVDARGIIAEYRFNKLW